MRKAAREQLVGALRTVVSDHLTTMRIAFGKELGTARREIERLLHQSEDSANERLVIVEDHLERIETKCDQLLEHEARARNEQKVVRKRLGTIDVEAVVDGECEDELLRAQATGRAPHECCGAQLPLGAHHDNCEVLAKARAAKKEAQKAKLSELSRIDPADAVRGAPTLPPRTITGLPGPAPRKVDGPLEVLGENGAAPMPRAKPSTSDIASASEFKEHHRLVKEAMQRGDIAGAERRPPRARPGGWCAPRVEIDRYLAERAATV